MNNYLKSSVFLSSAFLMIAAFSNCIFAQNYYVSADGNPDNSGTSIQSPFSSINQAIALAQPGDSIIVMPGRYSETITFTGKHGSLNKPIYITGFSDNISEYPIIDAEAPSPTGAGWDSWIIMDKSSWITISKMKFVNGWTNPISITNSSYISFDHCRFWGAKRAIIAEGADTHHILVENSYWDQGGDYLWTLKTDRLGISGWLSMHHGLHGFYNGSIIDFRKTGGSIVIRNDTLINAYNAIRWRGEEGYDSNIEIYDNYIARVRDNDFEPESYAFNLHIYHNFSHNIHRTLSIDHVNGGYIYYYGNVITTDDTPWLKEVSNDYAKLYGSEEDNLDYPLYIFNNSYYGSARAFRVDVGKMINVKHFNNSLYFYADEGWVMDVWDSSNTFDYDISNKDWAPNMIQNSQEQHGIQAEVMYRNPTKGDLRLKKDSPAIDAGKVMEFPELGWKQSYQGKSPDIGAYENGELVEGPPFRFIAPPGAQLTYKEKPRIVRDYVDGKNLILYFSSEIKPSSITKSDISIYNKGKQIPVNSISFTDDCYAIVVKTISRLDKEDVSISFDSFPVGTNGERATSWASTIDIHK